MHKLCRWRNRRWDCRFHKTGEAGVGNAGFKFSQINETVNENAGFGIFKKKEKPALGTPVSNVLKFNALLW